jgi:hypothetical protein
VGNVIIEAIGTKTTTGMKSVSFPEPKCHMIRAYRSFDGTMSFGRI